MQWTTELIENFTKELKEFTIHQRLSDQYAPLEDEMACEMLKLKKGIRQETCLLRKFIEHYVYITIRF